MGLGSNAAWADIRVKKGLPDSGRKKFDAKLSNMSI